MRFRVLCLLLAAVLPAFAARKKVTIDDVLAERDDVSIRPVWSPDGTGFAYLKDSRVHRVIVSGGKAAKPAVWVDLAPLEAKESAQREPRPYLWRNRRVSSETVQWLPDSQHILIALAGKLYVADHSGAVQPVPASGDIEDPRLSPDGRSVLYRSNNDLYVLSLGAGTTVRLTQDGSESLWNGRLDWVYPEELDLGEAAWWSPDSRHIAFLQFNVADELVYPQADLLSTRALAEPQRYPQAGTPNARVRLGIVDAAGGTIRWAERGNDPDILMARVAWLPDSSAVALETMPRIQNAVELWFCDPESGESRRILREESKTWINVADNIFLLRNSPDFLWTSERSGFRHIYRYGRDGAMKAQLTSGDWEVKSIEAISEQAGKVFFSSDEESPLETNLYEVDLKGAAPARITETGFSHSTSVNPAGTLILDESSNLASTPEIVLRNGAGKNLEVLHARSNKLIAKYDVPQSEIVKVKAADGTLLYGRLTKPPGFQTGQRYPLIVAVYGGPGAQSVRNEWQRLGMDHVYASEGYLVWRLDNRGSTGRGHKFEEVLYRNLGDAEVADQRAGVDYLISHGLADREHVGVTGWSYGGYMTIRCLLQAADVFKVGVAGAPVTDWHNYDTIYTERYLGLPDADARAYAAASNLTIARNLRGKLLLQMNFEDDNVLFQNTLQMVNAFEAANRQYEMQIYPFKTHGVTGDLRRPLYQGMLDFFNRNLR